MQQSGRLQALTRSWRAGALSGSQGCTSVDVLAGVGCLRRYCSGDDKNEGGRDGPDQDGIPASSTGIAADDATTVDTEAVSDKVSQLASDVSVGGVAKRAGAAPAAGPSELARERVAAKLEDLEKAKSLVSSYLFTPEKAELGGRAEPRGKQRESDWNLRYERELPESLTDDPFVQRIMDNTPSTSFAFTLGDFDRIAALASPAVEKAELMELMEYVRNKPELTVRDLKHMKVLISGFQERLAAEFSANVDSTQPGALDAQQGVLLSQMEVATMEALGLASALQDHRLADGGAQIPRADASRLLVKLGPAVGDLAKRVQSQRGRRAWRMATVKQAGDHILTRVYAAAAAENIAQLEGFVEALSAQIQAAGGAQDDDPLMDIEAHQRAAVFFRELKEKRLRREAVEVDEEEYQRHKELRDMLREALEVSDEHASPVVRSLARSHDAAMDWLDLNPNVLRRPMRTRSGRLSLKPDRDARKELQRKLQELASRPHAEDELAQLDEDLLDPETYENGYLEEFMLPFLDQDWALMDRLERRDTATRKAAELAARGDSSGLANLQRLLQQLDAVPAAVEEGRWHPFDGLQIDVEDEGSSDSDSSDEDRPSDSDSEYDDDDDLLGTCEDGLEVQGGEVEGVEDDMDKLLQSLYQQRMDELNLSDAEEAKKAGLGLNPVEMHQQVLSSMLGTAQRRQLRQGAQLGGGLLQLEGRTADDAVAQFPELQGEAWPDGVPAFDPYSQLLHDKRAPTSGSMPSSVQAMVDALASRDPAVRAAALERMEGSVEDGLLDNAGVHVWEQRMVLHAGPRPYHPANRLVKLCISARDLQRQYGLSDAGLEYVLRACGRRYREATGVLTLTCEKFYQREDNRREIMRWMLRLAALAHTVHPCAKHAAHQQQLQDHIATLQHRVLQGASAGAQQG